MRRYLFFINQLYSYSILRPLQEVIREQGGDVAWFVEGTDDAYLRDDENQLHTVKEVKEYNPLAVFAPGNWVPDFFPGVKVEVFHGLANDLTGKKGHFRIRGLFDLYCTHAPDVTRVFDQLAARYKTFMVQETGWPKLDPLFNPDRCKSVQSIDLRCGLNTDKPVVFYASTFSPSLTSSPYLVNTIKELSEMGDWQWLITLHPKTPETVVNEYKALAGNNLTYIESSFDVLPLLKAADVMLCDTSSIALEFMMLDKPVVTYRTKVPGTHVINVTDVDDIKSAISTALTRPKDLLEAMRSYVEKLHVYRDGKSSERVLQAVDDFIEKNMSDKLKRKPLNIWRKIQIRKKMRYYHLR
ncbi:MAG: CDP-glycerol glycerophosphotransferase family protein [Gammaproteobacteria bacterium]|nr:CDP-glycerol glycerophosphotransferase family protein [Gammaproteobacteria bacterium]